MIGILLICISGTMGDFNRRVRSKPDYPMNKNNIFDRVTIIICNAWTIETHNLSQRNGNLTKL